MQAYLINLDRSQDRLEHMRQQFARIDRPFVRVPGVDGSRFSADEFKEFVRRRPLHSPWSEGLAGCLLSHVDAWRLIAAADDRYAAVFEDDAHFAAHLGALLASDNWIPDDADVVRLEANGRMVLKGGRDIAVAPGRRLHEAVSGTWGSAGYIISRDAAERAARAPDEWHHSPDNFLFKPGSSPFSATLRRYQIKPAVCIQDMLLQGRTASMRSLVGSEWGGLHSTASGRASRWAHLLPWRRKEPVPFRA